MHVRWWSTVIRVPTDAGDLYFKANAAPHRFEATLIAMLADLKPGRLPEIVAADPATGWILMRDGGTRLREAIETVDDLVHWEEILARYAELQLATAPHAHDLLALGVPDLRLPGLTLGFHNLLDDDEAIMLAQPNGLTTEERDRLLEYAPMVSSAVDVLAAQGLPATIQHDDLHDGNVFVQDGRYVIFDWGDSSISHPFHTLVVIFRVIAYSFDPDVVPGGPEILRLRDAYLEPFADYGSHAELVRAVDLAHLTGTIARTLAWHRFVSAREARFRGDDVEAVPYGLRRLLNLGPLGTWASGESPRRPASRAARSTCTSRASSTSSPTPRSRRAGRSSSPSSSPRKTLTSGSTGWCARCSGTRARPRTSAGSSCVTRSIRGRARRRGPAAGTAGSSGSSAPSSRSVRT